MIINEALELGRTFSAEESVKFINGMLDAVRKKIERPVAREPGRRCLQRTSRLSSDGRTWLSSRSSACRSTRTASIGRTPSARSWRPTEPRVHDELEAERPETITSGRILGIRSFGKANFLVLSDGRQTIQAYVRQDALPPLDFQIFKLLDFGDWVGVEGRLFRTRTNELTIWASRLHFLAKCLLPLPEKWHGLTDVEIRYRQRYLDLRSTRTRAACSRRAAAWSPRSASS